MAEVHAMNATRSRDGKYRITVNAPHRLDKDDLAAALGAYAAYFLEADKLPVNLGEDRALTMVRQILKIKGESYSYWQEQELVDESIKAIVEWAEGHAERLWSKA